MSGRAAAAYAVVALVLVAASYWLLFVRPERIAEHARPQSPEMLVLATVAGGVEVAGPDGNWRPVRAGEHLSARDRIRTDDEGEAELRAADGSTVKLWAATEARVDELRRELKRFSLATGQLTAEVRDDTARVFEVEVDGHGGVARSRGGRFTASADGSGNAAVAAHRGEVVLAARGREVVIRSGQFARISNGQLVAPEPIPQSLFLKVEWPPALNSHKAVTVSGHTAPSARVKIAGHYVRVDADGSYRATVELPDGTHELDVHATDVAGHVVDEKSPRIVVDTTTDFKAHVPKWK